MRIKNRSERYVRRNKTLYVLWGDKSELILQEASGNEPQTLEFTVKPVYNGHPWGMARWP